MVPEVRSITFPPALDSTKIALYDIIEAFIQEHKRAPYLIEVAQIYSSDHAWISLPPFAYTSILQE